MTQQRSTDDIRTDIAVMDGCETWSERYHDSMIRVLRDVEPLLARAERAEAQVRAVEAQRAEWERNGEVGQCVLADVDSALAAGLSLQEEQPTHLVGAGGWRACDTAADWAGSDTTGVTCAECLATTTDVLQEEQE